MADLHKQMLPYRGRKGQLYKDMGAAGMAALYQMCDGSPQEAAEFLGYRDSKTVRRTWAMLQLPAQRRISRYHRELDDDGVIRDGFAGSDSTSDIREAYIAATSRREMAPCVTWSIPKSHEYAQLVAVSDLHYGPPYMDYARWLKMRDWIADNPHVRWVGLGDFLDTAVHDSPGMGGEGQVLKFGAAVELLTEDLRPIARQCFAMLSGNHEARVAQKLKLNYSVVAQICKELGIYYGGRETYMRIEVTRGDERQSYDAYFHHGVGAAQTAGGKINRLFKTLEWNNIDLLAMGHTHARVVMEQVRKALDAEVVEQDGKRFVEVNNRTIPVAYAGSFLKHERGSYSRDMALSPASLGCADFRLYTDRHSVHGRV